MHDASASKIWTSLIALHVWISEKTLEYNTMDKQLSNINKLKTGNTPILIF